jgi:hypothetical protein
MFDPGAMGTLLIGLNRVEANARGNPGRRPVAHPRREHTIRLTLARGLRRAAALLEPLSVAEPAS